MLLCCSCRVCLCVYHSLVIGLFVVGVAVVFVVDLFIVVCVVCCFLFFFDIVHSLV